MKYQSEIIKEIIDTGGHKMSSHHYESECIESWIKENKGAYPKLCDYQSEWLNYISILDDIGGGEEPKPEQPNPEPPIGQFPYVTLTDVTEATVDNVVPYAYKSAILKGKTDENLQSVKMPVLTTTGKNLFDGKLKLAWGTVYTPTNFLQVQENKKYVISEVNGQLKGATMYCFDENKNQITSFDGTSKTIPNGVKYIKWYVSIKDGVDVSDLKIQIEEGTIATSYEPYKTNILTTSEEVKLGAIGDIRDELDLITGELTERVGYNIVDGVNLKAIRYYPNDGDYAEFHIRFPELKGNAKTLSTFSPSYSKKDKPNNAESFWANDGSGTIGIIIQKTKLSELSVNGLNEYLKLNPIKFYYELKTESIKTVELTTVNEKGETTRFKPLEGTMHLSTSSETINPLFSGEIPVEAITQNLASFIEGE